MKEMLNIREIWTHSLQKQETVSTDQELLALASTKIKEPAQVYAVMDHMVAFGLYDRGKIEIALADPDSDSYKPHLEKLSLDYVQELRIFQADCELRLIRSGDSFLCRWRQDFKQSIPDNDPVFIFDELHKL